MKNKNPNPETIELTYNDWKNCRGNMQWEVGTKFDLVEFERRIIEKLIFCTSSTGPLKKQWLRSKEVQEMLGISASSLQNMRIDGCIPYSKVNGTLFYDYDDILKTLEKGKMRGPID